MVQCCLKQHVRVKADNISIEATQQTHRMNRGAQPPLYMYNTACQTLAKFISCRQTLPPATGQRQAYHITKTSLNCRRLFTNYAPLLMYKICFCTLHSSYLLSYTNLRQKC